MLNMNLRKLKIIFISKIEAGAVGTTRLINLS